MRLFVVCLVAATLLWPALAQAPGDRDFRQCGEDDHTYPPEWHVVYDTWNYEELFDKGPLRTLNEDGGSGWIAGGGGSCREQLRICDYRRPIQPQNNWVFTQFINYLEATEIFVNASYQYISCINNARRGCSVLHTTAYRYETNRRVGNIARVNPANYLPNEVAVLYLADDENSGNTIATFRPSSSAAGFYLGVQDTGTCGSIERITAYYRVIPSRTDGLIEYPEIPLPPVRSSDTITRSAVCAPHSINSSNLELSADSNGIVEGDPSCLCDPGYQLKPLEDGAAQCIACRPGTYKASTSNAIPCQPCPANSASEESAAVVCTCGFGFDRPANEPDEPCTKPPSSPKLAVNSPPLIEGSDLHTCWLPSTDRGGRSDFHYNIYALERGSNYFKRINEEDILPAHDNQDNEDPNEPICYTLSVGAEDSSFTIVVVATNGAADDPDEFDDISVVQDRFIAFYIATSTGPLPKDISSGELAVPSDVPGRISEVDNINGVAVWKPPEFTGGDLIGYVIRLYYYDGESLVVAVQGNITDPDIRWWVPEGIPDERPLFCQIYAINENGAGEWSEEVLVDTPDTPDTPVPCPSCPEIQCPSCPTVEPRECPIPTCTPCPEATCPTPPTQDPETSPPPTIEMTTPTPEPPPTDNIIPLPMPTCPIQNIEECSYQYCADNSFRGLCILKRDGCDGGTACQITYCSACYQGERSNSEIEAALSACSDRECSTYRTSCARRWSICIRNEARFRRPTSNNGFKCVPHPCI